FVGGRQEGKRSAAGFHDAEAIARLHPNQVGVDGAAEAVLLPFAGGVAPDHAGIVANGETLHAGDIFIGDGRFVGLRAGFLAHETGRSIEPKAPAPRGDSYAEARKLVLETRTIGFHGATGGAVGGPRVTDLFGFAREVHVGVGVAGHHEGRVPEGEPFFAFHH